MKNTQKQKKEKITLESLYALMRENEEESIREWKRIREEAEKRSEELDKRFAETERIVRENSTTIGSIGNSNGDVAEEYFQNAFKKNPELNGETYDIVRPNVRPAECDDEYDIFLLNGESAAIIEIKYNVRKDDIGKLLQKAENFRKFLTQYSNFKLYLGIASLSFKKITEQNIIKEGIAVIKQVGDKMVIYDKNLKVF